VLVSASSTSRLTKILVPDLAFSEMEFLQRTTRVYQPNQENKSSSKEKEKRKSERIHSEISTFFQPAKQPLKEVSSNSKLERSPIYINDDSTTYGRIDHLRQACAPLQVFESQKSINRCAFGFPSHSKPLWKSIN